MSKKRAKKKREELLAYEVDPSYFAGGQGLSVRSAKPSSQKEGEEVPRTAPHKPPNNALSAAKLILGMLVAGMVIPHAMPLMVLLILGGWVVFNCPADD